MLLTHWLKNLFRYSNSQSQARQRHKVRTKRLGAHWLIQAEILEDRTLLSNYTVDLLTDEIDGDTSSGDLSLREAVQLANSDGVDSTIVLAAGTYELTITGALEDGNQTGDLDALADGALTVIGAGVGQTIITAGGSNGIRDRVFDLRTRTTFDGVTVSGGYVGSEIGTFSDQGGGGIRHFPSGAANSLKILNSEITGNFANRSGGGVYLALVDSAAATVESFPTLEIANSVISYNNSYYAGGVQATALTATNSEFHHNIAGLEGGAVRARIVNLKESSFHHNRSDHVGSALALLFIGDSRIEGVTIRENSSPNNTIYSGKSHSWTNFLNTTIVGNTGGVFYASGSFANNWTPNRTDFRNTTIAGNSGYGIYLQDNATGIFRNTILAGNAGDVYFQSNPLNAEYSLVGSAGSPSGVQHGVNGNIVGNNGSGVLDPTTIFRDVNEDGLINAADLADNGGPTLTLALADGSPAIDAGNTTGLTTDQRGEGFPRLVGDGVDMGAIEYDAVVDPTFYWDGNTDGDGDGVSWDDPLNWARDLLPGTDADVVIAGEFAGQTIIHSTGDTNLHSLQSAANLTISGGVFLIATDSNIDGTLTFSDGERAGIGVLTVNSLVWSGGTLVAGEVVVQTLLSIEGVNPKTLANSTLTLAATAVGTWTGTGRISPGGVGQSAVFNNHGTFDIQSDADLSTFSGTVTINNTGIFRKSGGDLTTLDAVFNNSGIVDVQSNILRLDSSYTQTDGETIVAVGATLRSNETLEFPGGSLLGAGTIEADVANSGAVVIPSMMTIDGNYTQNDGGRLVIGIEDGPKGVDADQLVVTGDVHLNDAILDLSAVVANPPGTPFVILDNLGTNAIDGQFRTEDGQLLAEGSVVVFDDLAFEIVYSGGTGNDVAITLI
ncbi:MAG: hypothetical protein KDA84_09540, partial [Planctomycetaceae bacterium]|nr:hypothetical protein [Planctomycetaceae bacterium]